MPRKAVPSAFAKRGRALGLWARLVLVLVLATWAYFYLGNTERRGWDRFFPAGGTGPDLFDLEGKARPGIAALTDRDERILSAQRARADELAMRYAGVTLSGRSLRELRVIQKLVDSAGLRADQTYELQSLGVALGDVMAHHLGLKWVVLEDEMGRSRALRETATERLIFPVTMISKRVEQGLDVDVEQLYRKTADSVRPAAPFDARAPMR